MSKKFKPTDKELLIAIQVLLSGREWDADTLQSLADILNINGYPIADYEN
jgi:hypothetical protein